MSASAVRALAGRWRAYLAGLGLAPGDRVAVALRHGADLYGASLGALLGGFAPAMFAFPSPKMTEKAYFATLRPIVGVAAPRVFVTFDAREPVSPRHWSISRSAWSHPTAFLPRHD